tara:strand:+ start:730 stop:1278 length:549 start_codon:yes stop_codon:yes gene_type:complete
MNIPATPALPAAGGKRKRSDSHTPSTRGERDLGSLVALASENAKLYAKPAAPVFCPPPPRLLVSSLLSSARMDDTWSVDGIDGHSGSDDEDDENDDDNDDASANIFGDAALAAMDLGGGCGHSAAAEAASAEVEASAIRSAVNRAQSEAAATSLCGFMGFAEEEQLERDARVDEQATWVADW